MSKISKKVRGQLALLRPRRKKVRVKKKKPQLTPIQRAGRRYSKELAHRATPAERRFKIKLLAFNFGFSFQKPISDKRVLYITDFFVPVFNLDIELDGGYHNTPRQIEKDKRRDAWFIQHGYNVWRLSNEEADAIAPHEIINHLSQYRRDYSKA